MAHMKGKITIHGETGHMAVNVKTHGMRFIEGGTEAQRDSAWEYTVCGFWDEADSIAKDCGFAGVESEGHSDGWAAPFYGCGNNGRVYLLDNPSAKDARKFLKFAAKINALLADVPETFATVLHDDLEDERKQHEESERIVRQFCEEM